MAKVLDCGLEVSEFEPQAQSFVHFRIITHGKDMNLPHYPPELWVKYYHFYSSTMHKITHESWYSIKKEKLQL